MPNLTRLVLLFAGAAPVGLLALSGCTALSRPEEIVVAAAPAQAPQAPAAGAVRAAPLRAAPVASGSG